MNGSSQLKSKVIPVEVEWKGGKLVEAKIRNIRLTMDAPPFEGEERKSLGPSATESFMAALGRCHMMSILKAAEDEGVEIKALKARLEGVVERKDPEETGFKQSTWRFKDITINLEIVSDADDREIARVLRESHKYCTVGNAVRDGISGKYGKVEIKKS